MKKIVRILFLMVTFLGTVATNFAIANEVSMYQEVVNDDELIHAMAGLEYDNSDIEEDAELEGLGRLISRNKYSGLNPWYKRQLARSKARRYRRKMQATRVITPAMQYIIGSKRKLGSEVQKFLDDKKGHFTDGVLYFAKEYQNIAGIVDVIKSGDTFNTGYSNLLPNGIVPIEQTLAMTYVAFMFNEYDSASDNLFTNLFTKAYNDPRFANAELKVLVGKEVVFSVPVAMMNESRVFDSNTGKAIPATEHYGFNLSKPVIIPGNKSLDFRVEMADGTEVINTGTNRIGLKFIVAGDGTRA